jgi:NADPH2:quinone reductase
MKAIVVHNPGPDSQLAIGTLPEPVLNRGEVMIDVKAAGVNRADLLQRAAKYPPPPGTSDLLGLEVSGVIESVGEGVVGYSKGDAVCALLSGGGYAERVNVPVEQLMRIPLGFSFSEAAAVPEAFITAYTNLFREGGLRKGERVLIHGGSSGVGTAAIQLAKTIGAAVACTVGSDEKAARCSELGADLVINYRNNDFASAVKSWASDGVDLVLDIVGQEYFERNLAVLGTKGRLVQIATMSGAKVALDLSLLMKKRLSVVGSVLRSRTVLEKGDLVAGFCRDFGSKLESRGIAPVVDSVFEIAEAEKAHALMRRSEHVGKIVLTFS